MTTTLRALTDNIVREYTAFSTADEMRAAMQAGYVPTVSKRRQEALLAALNFDRHIAFVTA